MYMSTHTNTHTAEVAHDKALLDLLWTAVMADHKVVTIISWTKSTVSEYHEGYRGGFNKHSGGPRDTFTYEEIPVGSLYTVRERNARGYGSSDVVKVKGEGEGSDKRAFYEELTAALEAMAARVPSPEDYYGGQDIHRACELLADLRDAEGASEAAHEAVRVHELDYTGWSRFWLVTSSAGHVHSSTACSNLLRHHGLRPVPRPVGLRRGRGRRQILGETLCSVCFPTAPVEYTTGKKITKAAVKKLTGRTWEA